MHDASEKCMEECKGIWAASLKSMKPALGESTSQLAMRKKAMLIAELIDSGCANEHDRNRLDAMPIIGLIAELCGCKCSGYFPYKCLSHETEPDPFESDHPPPNGAIPP